MDDSNRSGTARHEWIARNVFGIDLEESAAAEAIDGRFTSGPLRGRTVNVKWYLKREGILDMAASASLDYYLVMTGPASSALSSKETTRPWRIDNVHLFDAQRLRETLLATGRKIGVASSVRATLWADAEIYPEPRSATLSVTEEQVTALRMFQ